jgi:hypothetical protein
LLDKVNFGLIFKHKGKTLTACEDTGSEVGKRNAMFLSLFNKGLRV